MNKFNLGDPVILRNCKCCGAGNTNNLLGCIEDTLEIKYHIKFIDGNRWYACEKCLDALYTDSQIEDNIQEKADEEPEWKDYVICLLIVILIPAMFL